MKKALLIFTLALIGIARSGLAADTIGNLIAVIDGHSINMPVTCEDTPMMINSYSDSSTKGKSDADGDGIYFTLGGIASMKNILGVFVINGEEYKFVHKGEFTLDKMVIEEVEVNKRDGSTYKIKIDLTC